jgi:hypothetical protein
MRVDELASLDPNTPWLEYINRYLDIPHPSHFLRVVENI